MRVKRQKANRRTVRFLKTIFGYRPPFKVLVDGTLLHYILAHKMVSPEDLLQNLLSAPARPFTTRCVIAELKKLGESFKATVQVAKGLSAAKCDHEPLKAASECLESLVQNCNPDHFFVATQDAELRRKLRKNLGVAIILAQNNFLVLETPSEKQKEVARMNESERSHVKQREYKIMEAREKMTNTQSILSLGEGSDDGDGDVHAAQNDSDFKSHKRTHSVGVADRPQFKRKKVKGPNPLSCKKKKPKTEKADSKAVTTAGEDKLESHKRRRRKHKKSNAEPEKAS